MRQPEPEAVRGPYSFGVVREDVAQGRGMRQPQHGHDAICGLPCSELIVLISSIIVGLTGLLLSKFQSKFDCDLITHLRAQIIRFSMNQVTMTNKAAPKKKMVAARRKE